MILIEKLSSFFAIISNCIVCMKDVIGLYLIAHLYGDRDNQMKWHQDLRAPLLILLDNGTITRFVLTYHYKGKESDNLYLCMEIPTLSECTMEALKRNKKLKIISDYLTQEIPQKRLVIGNYEDEVRDRSLVDKASRGSEAAIKILKENPDEIRHWMLLLEKIINYCGPLNENANDAAHFCFNSLGINRRDEIVVRTCYPVHHILGSIIQDLFKRESWE